LLLGAIRTVHPNFLTSDGEWVDLSMLAGSFGTQADVGVRSLLPPL